MLLSSCYFADDHMEGTPCVMCEQIMKEVRNRKDELFLPQIDHNAELAQRFPKYWKPLPANWQAIDTYRINKLFPVVGDDSGMILHARKKLLVPGVRTGGKSLITDIREAHATLSGWLADNQPQPSFDDKADDLLADVNTRTTGACSLCHGSGLNLSRSACFCKRVSP